MLGKMHVSSWICVKDFCVSDCAHEEKTGSQWAASSPQLLPPWRRKEFSQDKANMHYTSTLQLGWGKPALLLLAFLERSSLNLQPQTVKLSPHSQDHCRNKISLPPPSLPSEMSSSDVTQGTAHGPRFIDMAIWSLVVVLKRGGPCSENNLCGNVKRTVLWVLKEGGPLSEVHLLGSTNGNI